MGSEIISERPESGAKLGFVRDERQVLVNSFQIPEYLCGPI
jgi:hypothetical protein